MKHKKIVILLIFSTLFIPLGKDYAFNIKNAINANTAVFWTPTNPNVEDTVTIQYNTTAGTLDSSISSLYLQWAFDFNGNYDPNLDRIIPVPPSKIWYPPNSTIGYNGFFLASPMTKVDEEIWEISIDFKDDLPDRVRFYFSVNPNGATPRDGSQNDAWYIEPFFSSNGIFIIDPSIAETNFYTKSDPLIVTVRGNNASSSWTVNLIDRSGEQISCSISDSSYDSSTNLWIITATLPTSIEIGLYDLKVTALSSGTIWSDVEPHAVQILNSFKNDYIIALIGDQEMNHYSGNQYAIDGMVHGNYNLSSLLDELSTINPDLLVNLGSVTFWGDIETMQQYNTFIEEFYDLPHVYVSSHRDRFIGSEAEWEYTGAGIGALDKIVGIRHKEWTYGTHYFSSIYTGDHRMDDSELDWFSTTAAASSGDVKFLMIHDPIGYETSYNPTGQNAIDEAGRQALAPIIKSNKFDYYIHSSAGIEGSQQVTETGAFHIGTKSIASGYYLLRISGDEIVDWGYGAATDGAYPWKKVNVTFSSLNDGTEETASGSIINGLDEDLPSARIIFKMKSGNLYTTDTGEVYSQYTKDGITYVEVHTPISASTTKSITVSKVTEATNTTATESSPPTTTAKNTPGYSFFLSSFALIPLIKRKYKK
ncbi:MAG: hypothetical protein ACTSW1_12255 [Candidatus Hodarchaeales archaeon]